MLHNIYLTMTVSLSPQFLVWSKMPQYFWVLEVRVHKDFISGPLLNQITIHHTRSCSSWPNGFISLESSSLDWIPHDWSPDKTTNWENNYPSKRLTNLLNYKALNWLTNNVLVKPGAQVRKPWCLLGRNWVGLNNPGRGNDFRKRSIRDIKYISSQK
jgi:hypothetical protein